ncbi:hypothetical protein PENSTE_c002G07327 [Penicillium steckii]|uniref:Rhodopsin domain-containing protein n=1 Tax=Penicillium steckii TaxID=303698 RepID=A0A1V6TUV9_9EURO|nr:hypothetical protein PENSTE_c002G07327 [Penicillium steckii]
MDDPPSKSESLSSISLVTQILCFVIISPLIGLRLFARVKLHHPFGVEDATCYIAWLLFLGHCICTLCYTFSPDTYFSENSLNMNHSLQSLKIFYVATMLYVPMVLCVKTSLIYTLIRLWSPYRAKVIALYAFLAIIITYYIVILLVKIFTCIPIHLFWEVDHSSGSCLNRSAIILADSIISVTTDLAILIFPVVLTWGLQMSVSKKLHIILILGAGGTAIAFSIYRLVLVVHDKGSAHQWDYFLRILLTDNAEGGLGLICTCIPAINKLIGHLRDGHRSKQSLPETDL